MPTKKSTKKTTKTKKATAKRPATKKVVKKAVAKPAHNKRATLSIIGIIALVICVFIAGGMAIYTAIDNYVTITKLSDFSIITDTDTYSTIAMNDKYLEVAVSDFGNPATEYQAKVDFKNSNAKVVVRDDADCSDAKNCTYQGKLSEQTLTKISNSAKAILGDDEKTTLGVGEYTYNDALIEICQSIIADIKEN